MALIDYPRAYLDFQAKKQMQQIAISRPNTCLQHIALMPPRGQITISLLQNVTYQNKQRAVAYPIP